ncbi:MAG: NADH-quinone oxidoreductase subunit J, partial [Rhodothermales bacterium]|nr:NADH-quinone oxidoreductase subunit J [Rhodothermales bacterium]
QNVDWKRGIAFILAMGVLAELAYVVAGGLGAGTAPVNLEAAAATGSAVEIARELFTVYAMPLEVIGILLLAATIGAVMLAKRRFV